MKIFQHLMLEYADCMLSYKIKQMKNKEIIIQKSPEVARTMQQSEYDK